MDTRKNRMSIAKLRTSDPNTLLILTQDVLGLPLGQIEPSTLVDLLALSELDDQVPIALSRDLKNFRKQVFGQINDLPDGAALAGFAQELAALDPGRIPENLREFLQELKPNRRHPLSLQALQALEERLGEAEPEEVELPAPRQPAKPAPAAPGGRTPPAPARRAAGGSLSRTTRDGAPSLSRASSTAAPVDERKMAWIEEDVLSRLENYGARGLKESVIIAGARHRGRVAYKDISDADVAGVLRKLKRESKLRFTSGRWILAGATGPS